jgi:hypothetical protein
VFSTPVHDPTRPPLLCGSASPLIHPTIRTTQSRAWRWRRRCWSRMGVNVIPIGEGSLWVRVCECVTPVLGSSVQPDGVGLQRGRRRSFLVRSHCRLPLRCGLAGGRARSWTSPITGGLQGRLPRLLPWHRGRFKESSAVGQQHLQMSSAQNLFG